MQKFIIISLALSILAAMPAHAGDGLNNFHIGAMRAKDADFDRQQRLQERQRQQMLHDYVEQRNEETRRMELQSQIDQQQAQINRLNQETIRLHNQTNPRHHISPYSY